MEITSNTAGITVPAGTIIVSITNDTAVLSSNVTGSGTPTFSAIGPSDTAAEDGGIIVKGTSDKTFLWRGTDGGVTYNSWLSSEHMDLASGKNYYVNGILIASDTNKVIGPTNGGGQGQIDLSGAGVAYNLGSAVRGSSLTSVGTLTALAVNGSNVTFQNSGSCELTLTSNASNDSGVYFNNGTANAGAVIYDHPNNKLKFRINASKTVEIDSDGDLLPGSATQDLGSSSARWANIYSADLQLSNKGSTNSVDNTWGDYTIQEGESDLFLINNRNGKKYKFNLTEVL